MANPRTIARIEAAIQRRATSDATDHISGGAAPAAGPSPATPLPGG